MRSKRPLLVRDATVEDSHTGLPCPGSHGEIRDRELKQQRLAYLTDRAYNRLIRLALPGCLLGSMMVPGIYA
jgi:hypothetical protein